MESPNVLECAVAFEVLQDMTSVMGRYAPLMKVCSWGLPLAPEAHNSMLCVLLHPFRTSLCCYDAPCTWMLVALSLVVTLLATPSQRM